MATTMSTATASREGQRPRIMAHGEEQRAQEGAEDPAERGE